MSIRIERATAEDLPGIRRLNQRLQEGGSRFRLPDSAGSLTGSASAGSPVWREFYVAQDSQAVRGGYQLKREPLRIGSSSTDVWNYKLPVSEGIVNRAYAMVGIQLLQDAMSRSERLYCLGMGGLALPLPKLLARLRWTVEAVPFQFRVIRSSGFLQNIRYGNRGKAAAMIAVAHHSGLGALATSGWRFAARLRQPRLPRGLTVETLPAFGSEADQLFSDAQRSYAALVERTAAVLNMRFPREDGRFIRLMARSAGRPLGWVALTRSDLSDHKQFGSMRVGCIADGLCDPEAAPLMVRLATERLIAEGVDLIVSNQSHAAWVAALRRCGFAQGPSNFILGRSPGLATPRLDEWHMNRGDGDGPINL